MKNSSKNSTSLFRDIYAYLVSLIAFILLLASSAGIITGVASKWINPVENSPHSYYRTIEYAVTSCFNSELSYQQCIKNEIEQEQKSYESQKRNWHNDLNETLGIMIPMFFITLFVFIFHWKLVRNK